MPDTTVTLTWNEPLNRILEEQIKNAAVDYLRDDPKFKQYMADGVKEVSAKLSAMSKDAVAAAMKEDVGRELGYKNTAFRGLLAECLKDYQVFASEHASAYAMRRLKEVAAAIDKIS